MKQLSHVSLGLLIAFTVLSSCTNNPATADPLTPQFQNGESWKVSYFFDKDKDETSDFSGYTFTFRDNGTLEAERNNVVTTGSWSVGSDDGSQRLVINISSEKPLSELNNDWVIVTSSDQLISLKEDNTDHVEELHFERIP